MAEYNFKTGVDAGEYRDFLNVSPAYCFTQLPEWSEVKDNWDHDICMLYKDGAPAVGALLLIRHLPMGKKLIYSPRGPVGDFGDAEAMREFSTQLKKYAKKIGAIAVKADPFVIRENYEKQNAADFGNSFDETIRVMQECGFVHRGLSTDINTAMLACAPECGCTLAYFAPKRRFKRSMARFSASSTTSQPP